MESLKFVKTFLTSVGLKAPWQRMAAVTALGTAGEFYVKPSYAFDANGQSRPWAMMSTEPGAVQTPVGFFPACAGILTALFL